MTTQISFYQSRMGMKGLEKMTFYFKDQEMKATEDSLGKNN